MRARGERGAPRAGYWAFGWAVAPFLVSSFSFPTGLIAAVYVLAIMQIVGNYQIYARPTFGAPCAALDCASGTHHPHALALRGVMRHPCGGAHAAPLGSQVSPRPGFFYHYLLRASGPAFSARNVLVRMTVTTVYTAVITAVACLIPFFGCGCPPGQLQVSCMVVRSAP